VDLDTLSSLPDDAKRKLWILTDEPLEDPIWNNPGTLWFTVLAASPKKVEASRQWEKDRNVNVHFTSNWTWPEIVAAFRY
jgi:hypothetical protein